MAPPMEIVLAGPREDPAMRDLLHVVRGRFLPNAVVMFAEEAPIGMFVIKDRPTAFVCENYACKLPVTAPAELAKMLGA